MYMFRMLFIHTEIIPNNPHPFQHLTPRQTEVVSVYNTEVNLISSPPPSPICLRKTLLKLFIKGLNSLIRN